jgi:hypothetical protein
MFAMDNDRVLSRPSRASSDRHRSYLPSEAHQLPLMRGALPKGLTPCRRNMVHSCLGWNRTVSNRSTFNLATCAQRLGLIRAAEGGERIGRYAG